ncbi:hypothetical protein BDW75DRAFT_161275 [Aspergillus navahoensis]
MCHDLTGRLFPSHPVMICLMTPRSISLGHLLCYVIYFDYRSPVRTCTLMVWSFYAYAYPYYGACAFIFSRCMYLKICLPGIGKREVLGAFGHLSRACLAWRGQGVRKGMGFWMVHACLQPPCSHDVQRRCLMQCDVTQSSVMRCSRNGL